MSKRRKAQGRWEAKHSDKALPPQRINKCCHVRNRWITEGGKLIPVEVYSCTTAGSPSRERMAIHLAAHAVAAHKLGIAAVHSLRIISDRAGEVILYGHTSPGNVRKVREMFA